MSKHTEGPWSRDSYGNVVDRKGEAVMFRSVAILCNGSYDSVHEAEANTDLLTIAPTLLKALEKLLAFAELAEVKIDGEFGMARTLEALSAQGELHESIYAARDVIAAAKGDHK
jgi:hypothetical protein